MADPPESTLVRERREKAARFRAAGGEPYPWSFPDRVPSGVVVEACSHLAPGASDAATPLRVAGRLRAVRVHGRTAFLDVDDAAGALQWVVRVDELGDAPYREWLGLLDPGDLVGARGHPLVTRRGEPSLLVDELTLLAKALAPPPEKFHGLQDPEERIRRRHLDLLASADTRQRFADRSLLVRETRSFLDDAGFLEVETNVLTRTAGGAAAEPFRTRSRYTGSEMLLRISLELQLKRLLIGGLERVYEVGRVFRNEDLDSTHSPEFTLLELYWAYADYTDMRGLVERLYARLGDRLAAAHPASASAAAVAAAFRPPFATVDWVAALEARSGLTGILDKSPGELERLARGIGATVPAGSPPGKYLDKLFGHYVEPTLERPTFVLDFPTATTPLAKRHRSRPGLVERFELFYRGVELANAYTELNDPDEQARRFTEQVGGDADAHYAPDPEFVEAMMAGMPPASGLGIGVDRLAMALLGAPSIKDVLLFPLTRERGGPPP